MIPDRMLKWLLFAQGCFLLASLLRVLSYLAQHVSWH